MNILQKTIALWSGTYPEPKIFLLKIKEGNEMRLSELNSWKELELEYESFREQNGIPKPDPDVKNRPWNEPFEIKNKPKKPSFWKRLFS